MSWQRTLPLADLPPGQARVVGDLLICRLDDGTVTALENCCSHADVPLGDQELENGQVRCAAHGARFQALDGAVVCPPAPVGLETFPTRLNDGWVEVDDA